MFNLKVLLVQMETVFGMDLEHVEEMEMEVVMEMVEAMGMEEEVNLVQEALEAQLEELVVLEEWDQMVLMETVHGMDQVLVMAKKAKEMEEEESRIMEERGSKVPDLIPLLKMCLIMTLILTRAQATLQMMDSRECLPQVWQT